MATKLLAKAKSPARRKHNIWTNKENAALVQFVALHKDLQETDKEWPSMRATRTLTPRDWEESLHQACENGDDQVLAINLVRLIFLFFLFFLFYIYIYLFTYQHAYNSLTKEKI